MKAIYKIENKINHKIYIGQSNNPERRFNEHCHRNDKHMSLIHRAILKYGEENFSFEIIGWFEDKEINEKEIFYIKEFRCLCPYGYNILEGGKNPSHGFGEHNNNAKLTNEEAMAIKSDLKDWKIPRRQILKKYKVTNDMLRHINEGTSWHDENENYPLRPKEKDLDALRIKKIIELLILTDIPQYKISASVGWSRSAAKEINMGRNHHDDRLVYPIRNNKEINKAILNL